MQTISSRALLTMAEDHAVDQGRAANHAPEPLRKRAEQAAGELSTLPALAAYPTVEWSEQALPILTRLLESVVRECADEALCHKCDHDAKGCSWWCFPYNSACEDITEHILERFGLGISLRRDRRPFVCVHCCKACNASAGKR